MVWYKSPTSSLGKDGNYNNAWFADVGTKAFLQRGSRNLPGDVVRENIRVTILEPGRLEVEERAVRFEGDAAKMASVCEGMKSLTKKSVAAIVYWTTQVPPHINVN